MKTEKDFEELLKLLIINKKKTGRGQDKIDIALLMDIFGSIRGKVLVVSRRPACRACGARARSRYPTTAALTRSAEALAYTRVELMARWPSAAWTTRTSAVRS